MANIVDLIQFPEQLSPDDYRINAFIDSTTKAVIMANLVGLFVVLGSWGYYRRFLRRSVDGTMRDEIFDELEKVLIIVSKNDSHVCGQRLICEIHAQQADQADLGKAERNIIAVFRALSQTSRPPDSMVESNRRAAILGTQTNLGTCEDIYNSCRLNSNDLANIVKAVNRLIS